MMNSTLRWIWRLKLYPSVPWLSLSEFLHRGEHEEWSVVGVHTWPERQVSIIPGAFAPRDFEARIEG